MPRKNNTADIIIIGGGIMGLCLSYFLTIKKQIRVRLFEKDTLASGSTGLCVGGIRQQFSLPSNIILTQLTLQTLKQMEKDFNIDFQFKSVGYLFLIQKEKTWNDFQKNVQIQKEYKVPVELLRPLEISKRWPWLKTTDLKGGTFCPEDGFADPHQIAMVFAQKARKQGVFIKENTKVDGILIKDGNIKGVRTSKGNYFSPIVVNTAGPWAAEVAEMASIRLPVQPVRRQVFMTNPFSGIPKPIPMIIDMDAHFYFRGEGQGLLIGKSDLNEPPGFSTHTDRHFLEKVIEHAIYRAPLLQYASILRGWGGLYAMTPDENPIIGQFGKIKGFFGAVGFSGHGFQHGPAVGKILSGSILREKLEFDLKPFELKRFQEGYFSSEKVTV